MRRLTRKFADGVHLASILPRLLPRPFNQPTATGTSVHTIIAHWRSGAAYESSDQARFDEGRLDCVSVAIQHCASEAAGPLPTLNGGQLTSAFTAAVDPKRFRAPDHAFGYPVRSEPDPACCSDQPLTDAATARRTAAASATVRSTRSRADGRSWIRSTPSPASSRRSEKSVGGVAW
jgi:hypothetical protein